SGGGVIALPPRGARGVDGPGHAVRIDADELSGWLDKRRTAGGSPPSPAGNPAANARLPEVSAQGDGLEGQEVWAPQVGVNRAKLQTAPADHPLSRRGRDRARPARGRSPAA